MCFINPQAIKSFFERINKSQINYLLVKNIGGELPLALKNGKDIDILVAEDDKEKFSHFMADNGYLLQTHPYGKDTGYRFGYGLSECQFWKAPGMKENLYIDCAFQLMCKSLTPKYWVPFNQIVQESSWKNKYFDKELNCWRLDEKTLTVYMLARCVFDKHSFSNVYIEEIEKCKNNLYDSNVVKMLETVFYKFTPTLIKYVMDSEYENIFESYISFKEY